MVEATKERVSHGSDPDCCPKRTLRTPRGDIRLPAFLPVTTFDFVKFPLDHLLQPYFKRFVDGIMVSFHYARHMKRRFELPTFVDSGGFASLFQGTSIVDYGEFAAIETPAGDILHPREIFSRQKEVADIAVSLDCLIPAKASLDECRRRQCFTIKNALYALKLWMECENPRPLLLAALQAWDADSARSIVEYLAPHPFHGYALGGMVPRASQPQEIVDIVKAIRDVDPIRPLHVFGIGTPRTVRLLFENGVDSVDSSSYIRHGVSGQKLDPETGTYRLCRSPRQEGSTSGKSSNLLASAGEIATMNPVLHNLRDTLSYLGLYGMGKGQNGSRQTLIRFAQESSPL